MTLKTLFVAPIAIILIVTLTLAGMIAGHGWSGQSRGQVAAEALETMRQLTLLQSDLRAERVASNLALGKPAPLPAPIADNLTAARRDTDTSVDQFARRLRAIGAVEPLAPAGYLSVLRQRLGDARAAVDRLLASAPAERTFAQLDTVQPGMVRASLILEQPIEDAGIALARVYEGLSGLLTEERLATSLRDHVGLIAAVVMPRINNGAALTPDDLRRTRVLLAQFSYLISLLRYTIEIVGADDRMRDTLAGLEAEDREPERLLNSLAPGAPANLDDQRYKPGQLVLVTMGERVNALRIAIVDAVVARVTERRIAREREFDLMLTGFGLVVMAIFEAIFLLSRGVFMPLSQLGLAITRIAAGDRGTRLRIPTATREIAEMVTAVETLREAALVADATNMRQRMAERQRLARLREAVDIAQSVRVPAMALERDVERLSEGLAQAIAFVAAHSRAPPKTLDAAAAAVRVGLAEIRRSAEKLNATFEAANRVQLEDRPTEEFVACVRAVEEEVDRRDNAVRALALPGLLALRDALVAAPDSGDLIGDQFQRIEDTVATVASMRAAIERAAAIVREELRLAA